MTANSSAVAQLPEDLEAQVEIPKIKPLDLWDKDTNVSVYIPAVLDPLIAYEIRLGPITYGSFDGYLSSNRHEPRIYQNGGIIQSKISLSFDPGLRSTLEAAFRKLFPRAVSTRSPDPPASLDVFFVTDLDAKWETRESSLITGVKVRVRLTARDSAGKTIDTLEGSGQAALQYAWSRAGSSEEAGEIALRAALIELVQNLRASPSLAMHLEELAEGRARPAGLVTTVRFDDRRSAPASSWPTASMTEARRDQPATETAW